MPNYAQLSRSNVVLDVFGLPETYEDGDAINFLRAKFGPSTKWVRCSHDPSYRGGMPGKGYRFDSEHEVFYSPPPHPLWTLDENFEWQPPKPRPDDGKEYYWDEEANDWVELDDTSS